MSVKVPEGYRLEPTTDPKVLRSRKYQAWTVGDLREMLADIPENASVWISRYDDDADDIFLRPLEHFASSSDSTGRNSYVTL